MPAFGYKRALGFSLIELMVAIAIIAILAGIALPSYQNYVQKSTLRAAQADVIALSLAIENHYQRTLSYPTHPDILEKTGTTAISAAFPSWKPSSVKDIVFKLGSGPTAGAGGGPGYTITATPSGPIASCALTLNEANARTMGTGSCKFGDDWL